MCRYCACELSKEQLSKKCGYKKNDEEHDIPWSTNSNNFIDYHPSSNLQPKDTGLPVIIDGEHLHSPESRLFCPMYWSLIPTWYKGDLKEWKTSTHNARIENLNESKIYSACLNSGKRCVIVMEGFYEFKKSGSHSEVYYLHSPQDNLLKAAGLFNVKKENGETLYSCTVITTESEGNVREIHNRVPVLLNEDADVEAWLNFNNVSSADALAKIKANQQTDLKFFKTDKVGSREPTKPKKVLASKSVMSNWLQSGNKKGLKRKIDDE